MLVPINAIMLAYIKFHYRTQCALSKWLADWPSSLIIFGHCLTVMWTLNWSYSDLLTLSCLIDLVLGNVTMVFICTLNRLASKLKPAICTYFCSSSRRLSAQYWRSAEYWKILLGCQNWEIFDHDAQLRLINLMMLSCTWNFNDLCSILDTCLEDHHHGTNLGGCRSSKCH